MSAQDPHAGKVRLRPAEDIQAHEWARLERARTVTGAKLAALLPAWLKAHMRLGTLPEPFKADFRVILPSLAELGISRSDPRIGYYFPGGQQASFRHNPLEIALPSRSPDMRLQATKDPREYIARFCKLNHLTGGAS